eukprot:CAMPEP_0117055216 /NCGR_PEP_ID=MMETSP0472-20121206/38273_1 /TAXON_ID=693140 ORGANISM="Tiarina fusus, Strain LIS" /NCGR_SAMPLE_ID=MMETSP0472 /ASSEMBLY_ACC=CAM_ASM_000603 /LENGTH=59 /DNA_ID=CAMNT_0004771117 /DNA_START=8 /DNA_END=187 /DNA_ORIENTATION=-
MAWYLLHVPQQQMQPTQQQNGLMATWDNNANLGWGHPTNIATNTKDMNADPWIINWNPQ